MSDSQSFTGQIDGACDAFESAWKAGERPRIEEFLERFSTGDNSDLFKELLLVDLSYRHNLEELPSIEEYAERFPDHVELIREAFDDPSITLGEYRLLKKLGRGGMGVVYKALHTKLKTYVALKVLSTNRMTEQRHLARFHNEMQMVAQLDHPNIVRAVDAREVKGMTFLVMEFIDGVDLSQLVRQVGVLPVGAACDMIAQAADGLQHAHEHGIVHRDVKPPNLIVNPAGTVKLLDLGLARFQASAALTAGGLTDTGMVMGTVDYMAPEQWDNTSDVDIRADIYSLGCTLFHLLAGHAPFSDVTHDTVPKKMMAHASAPVPPLEEIRADLPDRVIDIVERMMAKDAADRFQTPGEVSAALRQFSDHHELVALLDTLKGSTDDALQVDLDPTHSIDFPSTDSGGSDKSVGSKVSPSFSSGGSGSSRMSSRRTINRRQRENRQKLLKRGGIGGAIAAVVAAVVIGVVMHRSDTSDVRRSLTTLPSLHGGWWFDESPWFIPAVRQELNKALENGETEIDEVSLIDLNQRLQEGNVEHTYRDLEKVTVALAQGLEPQGPEREFVYMLAGTNVEEWSDAKFTAALEKFRQEKLANLENPTATQQHLHAVILDKLNKPEQAAGLYAQAIKAYGKQREFTALCRLDYGNMLANSRNEACFAQLKQAEQTAKSFDLGLLLVAVRCKLAFANHRIGPSYEEGLKYADAGLQAAKEMGQDHPLRALALEWRGWLTLDRWELKDVGQAFETAEAIRRKHLPYSPETTHHLIFDVQGRAMAMLFAGNEQQKQQARDSLRGLIDEYNQRLEGKLRWKSRPLLEREEQEIRDRMPNLHERLGDFYLFRDRDDAQVDQLLATAIELGRDDGFMADHRAPHLVRLQYLRSIVLARAGRDAEARQVYDSAGTDANILAERVTGAAESPADSQKVLAQNQRVYALTQEVARALVEQTAAERVATLTATTVIPKNRGEVEEFVDRTNLGLRLLAVELLCDEMLDDSQLQQVVKHLIEIQALAMRASSDDIRPFFVRYLKAARDAVSQRPALNALQQQLDELLATQAN